jgi:hypothetical protein
MLPSLVTFLSLLDECLVRADHAHLLVQMTTSYNIFIEEETGWKTKWIDIAARANCVSSSAWNGVTENTTACFTSNTGGPNKPNSLPRPRLHISNMHWPRFSDFLRLNAIWGYVKNPLLCRSWQIMFNYLLNWRSLNNLCTGSAYNFLGDDPMLLASGSLINSLGAEGQFMMTLGP